LVPSFVVSGFFFYTKIIGEVRKTRSSQYGHKGV
jgi:cytochrome c oxidase assembly factor CtaG